MAILIRRGLLSLFDKRKLRPGELAITTDGTKLYYCYSAGNVKEVVTVDDLQNILDAQPEAYHALQELISELNDNTSLAASMLAQINQNKSDIEAIQSDLSGYWELNPGTQLTTGQDLNDLMTPGVYYSPSSSITSTLLNTPDGVSPGFRLVVETSTELSYIHQIIIPHQTASTLFLRTYSPDTTGWRAWQKLLNQDDVINVLTSTVTDKPLSAAQGKVLQDNINAVNDNLAQNLRLRIANGFQQLEIDIGSITSAQDLLDKLPNNVLLITSIESAYTNAIGVPSPGTILAFRGTPNREFMLFFDNKGNSQWLIGHSDATFGWYTFASKEFLSEFVLEGSSWSALQNKKGDSWHRLQLNSNGAVKVYTSDNQGSSWDEINEVITESKVNSSDVTLTNMTSGITVYGASKIRKNSFLVCGSLVLQITGSFSANVFHKIGTISPAPIGGSINTVGEIDVGGTAVLMPCKVLINTNGDIEITFPQDISETRYLSAGISYFYA